MYDFRHASGCYWVLRYKSESSLKYRFGWKKSDMIYYYTQLLGMKDTIKEEDMLINVTKTDLERQVIDQQKQINDMKKVIEDILVMNTIKETVDRIGVIPKIKSKENKT